MKRFRTPKLRDGELRLYWGRVDGDAPDVVVHYQGDGMKPDSRLVMNAFCSKSPDPFVAPIFSKMNPSFVEELMARGYDITTIKFSIQKLKATP